MGSKKRRSTLGQNREKGAIAQPGGGKNKGGKRTQLTKVDVLRIRQMRKFDPMGILRFHPIDSDPMVSLSLAKWAWRP
jgi:hypothetical protein